MPGPVGTRLDEWKALAAKGEAPTDATLRKAYVAEVQAAEGDARRIDFTISTASVDRDRDTIAVAGWKLTPFKKNPVVLWAHDYSMPPVARATKIRVDGESLKATAEFAPAESYPFAETIYQLLKGGFLQATSVGFRPLKHAWNAERGGMDFEAQELLEFSIVPVPANADCLMEGKAAGIDVEPLKAWAEGVAKTFGFAWAPIAATPPPAADALPAITAADLAALETKLLTHVDTLAAALRPAPAPEADVWVLALDDADPDEPEGLALDPDDLTAALTGAFQPLVTAAVRSEVNALRGRVD